MNRALNAKIKAVQKEQVKLVRIETYLELLLGKVNESINELKVEELQLKSSIIEQYTAAQQDDQPTTSAQAAIHLNSTTTAQNLLIKHEANNAAEHVDENINKQMLALESLLVPLKKNKFANEEEEEEDEDDDDDDDDDENNNSDDDDEDYKENMEVGSETEEDEDDGDNDEYVIEQL